MTAAIKTETVCHLLIVLMFCATIFALAPGCGGAPVDQPGLVGTWHTTSVNGDYTLTLDGDGTCTYSGTKSNGNQTGFSCTWSTNGGDITVVDTQGAGAASTQPFHLDGDTLQIGSATWVRL